MDHDERILDLLRRDPPEGARELLSVYGPMVKGALVRRFGGKEESRVDAAINEAAFRVSRRVDAAGADAREITANGLGAYFLIATRNILVSELRRAAVDQHLLSPAALGQLPQRDEPPARDGKLLADLLACVQKLPEQQQLIVLADLRRGAPTPAAELAQTLGTKPSVIYVSRNKALKKLRKLLEEQGRILP